MTAKAAPEERLGNVHAKVTAIFLKVLERYEDRLDALTLLDKEEIEQDVLLEVLEQNFEPNPAMLSAITKFLKDNEISYDVPQIDELSDTERRLKERRDKRSNIQTLTDLKVVGE